MVDWTSETTILKEETIFTNFMHAVIGVYLWEFVTSLHFEWDLITGRKTFRWPLIFYFAGRYTLLGSFIGIIVALNTSSPNINCQALYSYNGFMGDAAVGFASINLALRVIAIYKSDKRIIALLVLAILGHWAVIFAGITLTAAYVPGHGCAIIKTNSKMISAVFIYSMGFDLVILGLSAAKLAFPLKGRSALVRLLFADGLIYFIIALIANTVATVFMILNLNPIMSIIFNVPAAVATTIVASRTVRRLTNFVNPGAERFNNSGLPTSSSFGTPNVTAAVGRTRSSKLPSPGVHVKMETFAHADRSLETVSPIKTREFEIEGDDLEAGHEAKY